jgi:opacity protein-like surface antigen
MKRFVSAILLSLTGISLASAGDAVPPVDSFGNPGWYLRGFVGVGLNHQDVDYTSGINATLVHTSKANTVFVGGGVGYQFNPWFRADVSGEYRSKYREFAMSQIRGDGVEQYEGYISSAVFLANGFIDLGTWNCVTPFVGAGIGTASNSLSEFSNYNPVLFGLGQNPTEWHLAYAAYAGVSYGFAKNWKLDFTYRYLNYGSITDTVHFEGLTTVDTFRFHNLYSHDFMIGLRWTCCDVIAPPPPVVTRG